MYKRKMEIKLCVIICDKKFASAITDINLYVIGFAFRIIEFFSSFHCFLICRPVAVSFILWL